MRNRRIKAGKINFSFSLRKAKLLNQAIESKLNKGYFIWIGFDGSVDRIVGYHFRRGWIADYCYHTGNHWIKDLYRSLKHKNGRIFITRYI